MRELRKDALRELRNFLLNLSDFGVDNKSLLKVYLQETLILSAIGGRVCYSKDILKDLEEDKRLNDVEEMLNYLERIARKHHYSIFAHTPVKLIVSPDYFLKHKFYNLFKMQYDSISKILYLNLRHIIEALSPFEFFYNFLPNIKVNPENIKTAQQLTKEELELYDMKIIKFKIFPYWSSVLITGLTRQSTHQIVRHQAFNFSQQSLRYVKLDNIKAPKVIYDEFQEKKLDNYAYIKHIETIEQAYRNYQASLKNKIPAEISRQILPIATPTNIFFSGFTQDFKEFVNLRKDRHSQFEIRKIAEALDKLF